MYVNIEIKLIVVWAIVMPAINAQGDQCAAQTCYGICVQEMNECIALCKVNALSMQDKGRQV